MTVCDKRTSVNQSAHGLDLDFIRAAANAGVIIDRLQTDGKLRRCQTNGHPEEKNGAYWFNPGSRCGWFQNWEDGEDGQLWFSSEPDNRTEGEKHEARLRDARKKEDDAKRLKVLNEATAIAEEKHFAAASIAIDHRYLENKGIGAHGARIDADGKTLLVPVQDDDGRIMCLQRISQDGKKLFPYGGRLLGGALPIGSIDPDGVVLIGEGFSTMATLYEGTGHPSICAFTASNLPTVARAIRARYPNTRICICADDDHVKEALGRGNAGIKKGREAADAIGCALAIPHVRSGTGSDFNDMAWDLGIEAVSSIINDAIDNASKERPMADDTVINFPPRNDHNASLKTKEKKPLPIIDWADIKVTKDPKYLVKNILPSTGLTVVYGPPKCGKTFWVFDLVMHVALGKEYRGHRVRGGKVLYCLFEGQSGFQARKAAYEKEFLNDHEGSIPFYLMATKIAIVSDHPRLIESIKDKMRDDAPNVVILDTLNRSFTGSESSDTDMTAYIAACDAIKEAFNCVVIVVHHSGLEAGRARGHTSLLGAADTQIGVTKDEYKNIISTVEYMKDGEDGATISSTLKIVEVGIDEDGDAITSCVLEPKDGPAQKKERDPGGQDGLALRALREAMMTSGAAPKRDDGVPRPVTVVTSMDAWRDECRSLGMFEECKDDKSAGSVFGRVRTKLQNAKLIGVAGKKVWLARDKNG